MQIEKKLKYLYKAIESIIENKNYIETTHLSIVGYSGYEKDHEERDHIQSMNFTKDIRDVDNFINKLKERNKINVSLPNRRMGEGLERVNA